MGYENRSYTVVPYQDDWPEVFEREAALVRDTLGEQVLYVEHVGGTAIPGLSAQPVVDLAAIVQDLAAVDTYEFAFRQIGYEPCAEITEEGATIARFFIKERRGAFSPRERIATMRVFLDEQPAMTAMLDLRDYLQAHPEEVRKLAEHKQALFSRYSHNYSAYKEHLTASLEQISRRAAKWRGRPLPADAML